MGQLPTVTVSLPPSVYALPVLLVEERKEWKDFGIQVFIRFHPSGEDQLDRLAGREWEVAVMDPLNAVRGGNEGDTAIVGVAGNFASQLPWLGGAEAGPSALTAEEGRWLRDFQPRAGTTGGEIFLPACLVAAANFADTRKTLVIRWLESYFRGIELIRKEPEKAASLLQAYYREKGKKDVPLPLLRRQMEKAFYFEEKEREDPLRKRGEKASPVEEFAGSLVAYLKEKKALEPKAEPSDYVLFQLCGQLTALRGEATAQLERTGAAIEAAARAGAAVEDFRRTWEEARGQVRDGRGCLTAIGVLSDLQRSADQSRVDRGRLRDFRRIEWAVGGLLGLYYAGYFFRRRRKASARRP